jgi:hypothetical protein
VQVHFWKQGEPTTYIGYTTNISLTGMFIATNSPMPSGARIRIEVVDRERGFMMEGVVAHARKMQTEMARLNASGMGVRFLSVEELVRELIPGGLAGTEEIPREAPAPRPAAPPAPVPASASAPAPVPAAAAVPLPAPEGPPRPVSTSGGTFSVHFSGPEEFMEVYRRDILQGGLFVSTQYPAHLQETVSVEMFPPGPFPDPLTVRARVVQRFDPQTETGPNLLAGMGLELLDLPSLVARLQPVVQRLRDLGPRV